MDEHLLKSTMERLDIKNRKQNSYSTDATTDLIVRLQQTLTKIDIPFKKVPKNGKTKKNSYKLRLFKNDTPFLDFNKGFYPNNYPVGKTIANDKLLTEQFLSYAGINTPNTSFFTADEYESAELFVRDQPGQCVLKPKDLSQSLGAFRDVNSSNLKEYWNRNLKIQKIYKVQNPIIIIQKQIEGLELRITVTEGIADTATLRAPGYIIGDGKSSIQQLIDKKNENRQFNNFHRKNLFKINDNLVQELGDKDMSLQHVLDDEEFLILYPTSNISTGRDNIEISEYIKPSIFKHAEDAVKAIPGIHTAGVDILIESLDATVGTVLEVNQNPAFQVNYFNLYGAEQDPLAKVFNSLLLEDKIMNDEISMDNLDNETLSWILKRYKFLYDKQKVLADEIHNLIKK